MRSGHSVSRPGTHSSTWRNDTTVYGTAAGAPGSIGRAPRRARVSTAIGPTSSGWFATATPTPHWSSTVPSRSPGANTVLRTSCPTSTHRKEYDVGLVRAPDYRITCFFVDRNYRRKGVAAAARRAALDLIAKAGGGVVEAYPQDTPGKKTSVSFLYNGTRSLFENAGFSYDRPKGKNHCVMRKTVSPS